MSIFLWTLFFCSLGFLPIEQALLWTYQKIKQTQEKLETQRHATYFCKWPVIVLASKSITILKSFLIPFTVSLVTESEVAVILSILCLIIPPLWLRKHPTHYELGLTLWGVFTFIHPLLAALFPLTFLLTLFFSQHIQWAILTASGVSGLVIIYAHSIGNEFVTLIAIISLISLAWWQKANHDDSKRYR